MRSTEYTRLHKRFEEQVSRSPDAPALSFEGRSLTYAELNARANQLAHHLQFLGVSDAQLVGLCLNRSVDTVVAILAVLKAGGAYVPMDPVYPAERVRMIVEDAQCPVVLVHQAQADRFAESPDATLVTLDGPERPWEDSSEEDPESRTTGDSLAYIIYTSGSTGKPKGVMIPHSALANYIAWAAEQYTGGEPRSFALFTSPAFDLTVTSIFVPLVTGGRIIVYGERARLGDFAVLDVLEDGGAEVLKLTPSHLELLLNADSSGAAVKCMILGGEDLKDSLAQAAMDRFGPELALYNEYGPTEATVGCMIHRYVSGTATGGSVALGAPIANTHICLLDEDRNPVEPGVTGELYIAGAGLALGYHNAPEQTEAAFVPNPFEPGTRMYMTGDLARRRADGELEFLGRKDLQVKIRGFRVDLGEIESNLMLVDGVKRAVVSAMDDGDRGQRLVAYYVAPAAIPVETLHAHQAKVLPDYMIPAAFIHLDAIPLTVNGKVDYRALPEPDMARGTSGYVAPRTASEARLARLWEDLLHVTPVGVEDSFLDLGGHSLLASRLLVRIEKEFSVRLPLRTVLEQRTVAAQAKAVETAERTTAAASLPVPRAAADAPAPLSHAQEQLWILSKFEPGLIAYNIPLIFTFDAPVDATRLENALNRVVEVHGALRTVFTEVSGGMPRQNVREAAPIALPVVPIVGASPNEQRESIARRARDLAGEPMDLANGPLVKACAYSIDRDVRGFILVAHHMVFDGWSTSVLLDGLARAFEDRAIEAPACTYADYALWQHEQASTQALERQRAFWRRALAGPLPVLEVPLDQPRPERQTFFGDVVCHTVDAALHDRVCAVARELGVTPFVLFLASWKAILYRYTGQEDCIVGVALAGRTRIEFEALIGFFVNTVAVRTPIARDLAFSALVRRVDDAARDAQDHQDVPFKQVVADCQPARDPSRSPVFQHMFVFHNTPPYTAEFAGISVRGEEGVNGGAKFDLTMAVQPEADGFVLKLEYNTALYERSTAEKVLERYVALLDDTSNAPDRPVGQLHLTDQAAETQRAGSMEVALESPAASAGCLHRLFERQAAGTPDAPAVTCEGSTLSYQELNARANQVAHCLQEYGVGTNTLVGLCLDRSIDTVVAILGVLKSGGAYVPMDPVYPAERMRLIVEDARCPVVITHVAQRERFEADDNTAILVLDAIDTDLGHYSIENPASETTENDLAYVIYTSGSTGKPKGALIYHRNVTRLFTSMEPWFSFGENDRWTLFHSYAFDFSVWEIWGAFLYGGRVVVVPYVVSRSPEQFYRLLVDEKITVLSQTPSAFRQLQLVEEQQPLSAVKDLALRYVVFGGEVLDLPSLRPWFERHGDQSPQLVNMYGITETTVFITYRPVSMKDTEPGTPNFIGIPIPDLVPHVLDENMKPVAVGEIGELYVGGAGVGGGYLRRPELNKERFIPDPFSSEAGAILYKTGDLVRLHENDLEFIGRNDNQVQLRGFRVELGEIESVLNSHESVRGSIVRAREDRPGDMRLVAYYLATADLPVSELRACIAEKLPSYMVPARFIHMDSFPLNNNGKVDFDALPAPAAGSTKQRTDNAPETDTEKTVAEIWRDFLHLEQVGVDDNFFELGGHSLLAIQVLNRINDRYSARLELRDLFDAPTVGALAEFVDRGRGVGAPAKHLIVLKEGDGTPFFCVKGAGDVGGTYDTLANALSENQPFYGFPDLDFEDLEASGEPVSVEAIARRCIEEIRQVRPRGPYYVGGYSFGGIVAYEIAQQLLKAGEEVPLIAMLDSSVDVHNEGPTGTSRYWSLLNRLRVRLMMSAYTWKLIVGYVRDGIRVIARRLLGKCPPGAEQLGFGDYFRWIQLDTSVQYFLIQAGLVKPSIAERRLDMVEEQLVRHSTRSMVASKQAMTAYEIKPIPAKVTLFRAEHNPWKTEMRDPTFGWDQFARDGVKVVVVPGNHMVLIRWPFATDLGKALQREIDALEKPEEASG